MRWSNCEKIDFFVIFWAFINKRTCNVSWNRSSDIPLLINISTFATSSLLPWSKKVFFFSKNILFFEKICNFFLANRRSKILWIDLVFRKIENFVELTLRLLKPYFTTLWMALSTLFNPPKYSVSPISARRQGLQLCLRNENSSTGSRVNCTNEICSIILD